MTSNIKVVDIEEVKQEENETVEPIPEEVKNESVVEQPDEIVSAPPEQPKPEPKKKEPPIPLDQPVKQNVRQQDKLVKCPQCDKQMKLKSYRYKHELTCKGKLEDIPRKPKAMPKPKAQPIQQEEEIEEVIQREALPVGNPKPKLTQHVSNQILKQPSHSEGSFGHSPKPQTPNLVDASADASRSIRDFASHYQLLQNQFIQQKKEKYNDLCQNMFVSRSKKR